MMKLFSVVALALAVGCATTASQKDTKNAEIHYDLGVTQLRQGHLRDALRELLAAVKANDAMPEVHNALGLVYHSLERDTLALEHYDRAIALKSDFSECHNNRGILLTAMGRFDEAIESYQAALNDMLYAFPAHAEANMGWAYFQKGDVASAERHLRNAVATNPKFCRGYEWLARVGLDQENHAQVIASVQRFEKHCMADESLKTAIPREYQSEMSYFIAKGYEGIGDVSAARASYERCASVEDTVASLRCKQHLRSFQ
jgi:type IV pilus biogenesis/stability protein PilW